MSKTISNNKRIAKNTLLLYFRMFITMAIGLYTSRVVLNVLGVVDYGIYNVVGGIITMVSFLNSAMVQASQRFLSFELGTGSSEKLGRIFCTSLNIHLAISVIAIMIGETIGLWFINSKLIIPPDRLLAANWVYQASIATFVIGVMSVPYNSAIVAHEKMSAFAYISILEVVLKLLIVYLLLIISFDKLIVYSILMVMVSFIVRFFYKIYCRCHFVECTYHFLFDKKLSLDMLSFSGWSVLGGLGFSFKDQISNIILNLFFGPAVNAARGIGMHVTALTNTFATNFTMALNPQIIKQYAAGNYEESRKLVYAGCRYSFYLLSMVTIPIIINVDYILRLWLGVVPKYTGQFVMLSLLASLLYAMSNPVTIAIQATGRIKWFQIGVCTILLSELPLAWCLMEFGFPPYAVMWPMLLTYSVAIVFRFWLLYRYVMGYSFVEYFVGVVLRCLFLFGITFFACYQICSSWNNSLIYLVVSFLTCLIITGIVIFLVGMNKSEQRVIIQKLGVLYEKVT